MRVGLLYPNTYHVGMSSLGLHLTYRVINACPEARAERFFLDSIDAGSIETGASAGAFDVLAFSACYEMDGPHALDLIAAAGLPLLARDRRDDRWPLVVMGGVLVSVNRLPLYPFIDIFLHGEAEALLPAVVSAWSVARTSGRRSRLRLIEAVDGLPGVEVTAGARRAAGLRLEAGLEPAVEIPSPQPSECPPPRPPEPVLLDGLDNPLTATEILTPATEFSNMALLDLARGCPHHCTFCWIGHNTPPTRSRPLRRLLEAVETWAPFTDRFGLVASAVGAHPEIDELCRWMMRRPLRVSYSSLRVEEVTPTMLAALAHGGQKTITIAPEAGNGRVRRLLGKLISDAAILDVVERALSLGVQNVKQYYMIGIPSETEDEAMEVVRLTEQVRRALVRRARTTRRMGYVGVNLGVFVPKPNLPLNHIEPLPLPAVKRRLRRVVQALRRLPNVRVNASSPDLALAQGILSMGGLEAAGYLLLAHELGGNWREANRRWRVETEGHLERHRRRSRLAADTVRARAGAAGP